MSITAESATGILDRFYPPEGAHGRNHAEQVANDCVQLANSSYYEGQLSDKEKDLLFILGLIHDSGYPGWQPFWSGIQLEHGYVSADNLERVLTEIGGFSDEEILLGKLVVTNHDSDSYKFPAWECLENARRGLQIPPYGRPETKPAALILYPHLCKTNGVEQRLSRIEQFKIIYHSNSFKTMLAILQECDSRLGDARRTMAFAESRGIPLCNRFNGVTGIGMPMWQYSGAASCLLAANRALLEARTPEGQEIALKIYRETVDFIKQTIANDIVEQKTKQPWDVLTERDNVGQLLREEDIREMIFSGSPLERRQRCYPLLNIEQAYPLETIDLVAETGIIDHDNVASILLDPFKLIFNERPYSSDIRFLRNLRASVISNYALDPLVGFPGAVRFSINTGDFMQAENDVPFLYYPPVIKIQSIDFSPNSFTQPTYVVDRGSSWVVLARILGLPHIRVIIDKSLTIDN